jgi:hypothetical protein
MNAASLPLHRRLQDHHQYHQGQDAGRSPTPQYPPVTSSGASASSSRSGSISGGGGPAATRPHMVETPHSYHLAGASSSTSPAMGHHQQPQGEEEAPLHCEAIEVRRAFRAFHPEDAGRVLQFGLKPDGAALGPKKSKVPLKSMLAEWNDAFGGIAALQQGGASSAGKVSSRSNGNSSSSRSRGHVGNITTATGGGGGEAQQPLSVVPGPRGTTWQSSHRSAAPSRWCPRRASCWSLILRQGAPRGWPRQTASVPWMWAPTAPSAPWARMSSLAILTRHYPDSACGSPQTSRASEERRVRGGGACGERG